MIGWAGRWGIQEKLGEGKHDHNVLYERWLTGGELKRASVWGTSNSTWHTVSTACLFVSIAPGHAGLQGKLEGQSLAWQPSVLSDKTQQEFCCWN